MVSVVDGVSVTVVYEVISVGELVTFADCVGYCPDGDGVTIFVVVLVGD